MIYDAESEGPTWAGERRGDTYGFTIERERERDRPDQSTSSHQAQSETDLGRKSPEQFVTVASPALPMQNWQQTGCVGTLGAANEPLVFIIRETGDVRWRTDAGQNTQPEVYLTLPS